MYILMRNKYYVLYTYVRMKHKGERDILRIKKSGQY